MCLKPQVGFRFQTFQKKCLKFELLGNQTVIVCLKSILVLRSDTHCIFLWVRFQTQKTNEIQTKCRDLRHILTKQVSDQQTL